jgi:hypothetical protein
MTEQQVYDVVDKRPGFEVRRYPAHVVAEVEMTGAFERAGNAGFGPLVSYISGRNATGTKVAMTAPVIQETTDEPDTHLVSFVMPNGSTTADLPVPATDRVEVHEVPEQLAAAATFSGRWTQSSYQRHVNELLHDIETAGLKVAGRPRYARFDPPWKPAFMRRNEVVIPVERP